MSLYAAAFALLVGSGVVFAFATIGQLASLRLLRTSAWLSAGAILVAIASVLVPRRR